MHQALCYMAARGVTWQKDKHKVEDPLLFYSQWKFFLVAPQQISLQVPSPVLIRFMQKLTTDKGNETTDWLQLIIIHFLWIRKSSLPSTTIMATQRKVRKKKTGVLLERKSGSYHKSYKYLTFLNLSGVIIIYFFLKEQLWLLNEITLSSAQ